MARLKTTPSIIGGTSQSKSSRHKGVIFAVTPPTPPEAHILKHSFKIFMYLLNVKLSKLYVSLASVLNITRIENSPFM